MSPIRTMTRRAAPLLALVWLAAVADPALAAAPVSVALGSYGQALQAPARVAMDTGANLFVTDPPAGQVVAFDAFGRLLGVRGGFARPLALAADAAGNFYLGEEQTGSVTVFDAQWQPLAQLGAGAGEFAVPGHVALDAVSNTVYVSDGGANLIKVYAGGVLTNQFGGAGTGNGQFDFPAGLCLATNGDVFVVDQGNDRVQVFTRGGVFQRAFSLKPGGGSGPSGRGQAACLDAAGRLYVADSFQGVVKVFDAASGGYLTSLGSFGSGAGKLNLPGGLLLDPFNRLAVASVNNARVELFGVDDFLHFSLNPSARVLALGSVLHLTATAGGAGPFTYQWARNGTNLAGATNASLVTSNITGFEAGGYSVVVTGPAGAVTSTVAQVSVVAPPAIVSAPESQTVLRGANVELSVGTTGAALSYQWRRNGANLPGATNGTLSLPDVQANQSGSYTVVVANEAGKAASAPSTLTVLVPPTVMEILAFTMASNAPMQLTFNLDLGFNYALDASTNMAQWQSIGSFTNSGGIFDYVDADSTNYWARFYRFRWVP